MTERTEKTVVLGLVVLSLVSAFGIRFPFWGDEVGTFEIISGSWSEFWRWYIDVEPHPPLYFALLKLWASIFGLSELSLRIPSAILFPAIVFLVWVLSRKFGLSLEARLFAVAMTALHPSIWIFARMARYYTFTATLFLLSTCALFIAMERGGSRWVLYGLLTAALFWSNFPAYLSIPVHLALILWRCRDRLLPWLLAVCAAIASAIPAVLIFLNSAYSYAEDSAPSVLSVILGVFYSSYTFLIGEVRYPWQVPTALGLIASLFLLIRAIKVKTRLSLIIAIGPVLLGLATLGILFQKLPFVYFPARLLFLLPTALIVVASGIERLENRRSTALIAVLLLGYIWGDIGAVGGRDYHNTAYVIPWRKIASEVDRHSVELSISRDWGAVFYAGRNADAILLREAIYADFPHGKIAHIWRSGAFRRVELDDLVFERIESLRGEPIEVFDAMAENPTAKSIKELVIGRKFPQYIVRVFIFDEENEEHVSGIPRKDYQDRW